MELDSDTSEEGFPIVALKPTGRVRRHSGSRGPRDAFSSCTTASRQAEEIVLSSDSEIDATAVPPRVDHATVASSIPLRCLRQSAGSVVAQSRCSVAMPALSTTHTVPTSPSQGEHRETTKQTQKKDKERVEVRSKKKREEEIQKATRKAKLDANKDHRPGERVKQMTVAMDTFLSEHVSFMAAFAPRAQEIGIAYRHCAHPEPGSVQWLRKVTERTVDDHAQVIQTVFETKERSLLVVLEAECFVDYVHAYKQVTLGDRKSVV